MSKIVVLKGPRPSQMLTIADGGGVQEPLILADVICKQPLKWKDICPK